MRRRVAAALAIVALAAGTAAAGTTPRFFVAGDGSLAVQSVHFGDRATVRYRNDDGGYDAAALARIARVLRSRDGRVGTVTPRFVELLARVQALAGGRPLRVVSGYRSPTYNAALRAKGRKAASASLHSEGMAADVAFDADRLEPLWHELRGLDCCGAGLYAAQGFLHVDVGPSRFWEAHTSRVDEDLSGGNARLFLRTEYDRYAAGEPIVVRLHSLTAPPVRLARRARVVADGDGRVVGEAEVADRGAHPDATADGAERGEHAGSDACIEADARTELRVTSAPPVPRGRLVLETCTPRAERTPAEVRTNPLEIR